MKKQRLPKGWKERQIAELARYHDRMTEEEQATEIEAAFDKDNVTLMAVPIELAAKVRAFIKRCKRPA